MPDPPPELAETRRPIGRNPPSCPPVGGEVDAALDVLAARDDTVLSVWAGSSAGPPWLSRLPDTVHLAASTMKLPLVVATYQLAERGQLSLDEAVQVDPRFLSVADGSPYEVTADYDNDDEPWQRVGSTVPVRWLAERSIVASSNLATNLLVDRVGTAAVADVYASVGATRSALRKGIQDAAASRAGIANTVTAHDLAAVVSGLVDGRLLESAAASEVEGLLATGKWNDAIPAGLPRGTYVAHKPGWIDECCHDVALVRPIGEEPFVLAVLTTLRAPGAVDEATAHALVAEAAGIAWRARPRSG